MLCIRSFKNCIELRTQEQPLVGKNTGGTIRAWNDPSRTDEVPFFAGCSHFARKNTKFRAQAFFPKQDPCNIHSAIPMRSCNQKFKNRIGLRTQEQQLAAKHIGRTMKRPSRTRRTNEVPFFASCSHFTRKHKFSCSGFLPKILPMHHSCSHSNAICKNSFKNRIELRTQEQPLVGKHIGGTIRAWNDPSRTDEVPFFAGCSHFTQKKIRAQSSFPKTDPCNIHSAIPMRSCNQKFKNCKGLRTQEQQLVAKHIGRTMKRPSRTRRTDEVPFFAGCSHFTRKTQVFVLRLPPQNITHASFMQPFQCDLQPQLQEPHRTTKTGTTNRCKHIGGTIRAWNDSSRTCRTDQVPFFASCSHFTRKNTRLRTPASSPKHNSCNIHAAITMRSCNQKFKNRIELRTQEEPLVAKHIGGTIKGPQPRHRRGTFLRRLQPLYTEKHTVSFPGVLTKKPMLHSCCSSNPIRNRWFQSTL